MLPVNARLRAFLSSAPAPATPDELQYVMDQLASSWMELAGGGGQPMDTFRSTIRCPTDDGFEAEGVAKVDLNYLRKYGATSTKSDRQLRKAITAARKEWQNRRGGTLPRAALHATTDDLEWLERLDRLQRCMNMLEQECPPQCPPSCGHGKRNREALAHQACAGAAGAAATYARSRHR